MLSIKLRHEIYVDMLEQITESTTYRHYKWYQFGFCYVLKRALQHCNQSYHPESIREFPELMVHEPKPENQWMYGYWWSKDVEGTAKRVEILESVIALTKSRF